MAHTSWLLGASALGLIVVPQAVQAQSRSLPSAGVPDIIVTAERRPADAQTVPTSVTAIPVQRIEDEAMLKLDRIGPSVPNLYLNRNFGTSGGALVFLRGVGEGDSIFTNDPPVGIYVDDVLLPRSTGALLDFLDIGQIEVDRGPQGTLYGRNTSGGAIKIATARPDPARLGGMVDTTIGMYRRFDLRGTLNVPLSSDAAIRVSGLSRLQRGWGTNLTNGAHVDGQDVQAGRAAFSWTPAGGFSLFATLDYSDERSQPRFPQRFQANPAAPGRYLPVFVTPGGSIDNFMSADTDPLNTTLSGGAMLRLAYATGRTTFTSITGYRELRSRIGFDQTANAPGVGANITLLQDQKQHNFSQEWQVTGDADLAKLRYVAGIYYFEEYNDQLTAVSNAVPTGTTAARFANSDFFAAPSRSGGNWSPYEPRLKTDSWSGYASLTAAPIAGIAATAGVRYTHEHKRYDVRFLSGPGVTYVLPSGQAAAREIAASWDDWSPRFALDRQFNGKAWQAMAYASASKGFRSGSFDGRARNIDFVLNRQGPISPETVWSYEAGVKTEWLDHRLRLNLAYFINDYTNIAFSAARVGSTPPEIFRQNVGDARIQGLEAELTARPVPSLEIGGVLGTLNDKLTRLKSSPGCTAYVPNELDLDLRFTPDVRWSARGQWTHRVGGGTLRLGGDYSGSSPYNIALCNDPQHHVDNYEAFDAELSWETGDGRWRFTLSGTNLSDRRYNTGSVGTIGYPADPRQVQVNIRRSF